MNTLDCVALLSISQYLIIGFIFISDSPISSVAENFLVMSLLITTVATMLLGFYYIFLNYRSTGEAQYSTTELINHTVGAWWKVTLGVREMLNITDFFAMSGGSSSDHVSTEQISNILERAQVKDVVGEGMAHLLMLLLDSNLNGKVSSEELYHHLWALPGQVIPLTLLLTDSLFVNQRLTCVHFLCRVTMSWMANILIKSTKK
jgi:hypothetical protein